MTMDLNNPTAKETDELEAILVDAPRYTPNAYRDTAVMVFKHFAERISQREFN